MFSGLVFLALASLAGIPPSAVAQAKQQEIRLGRIAPELPQRSAPAQWEPSAVEEEDEEDGKRHSSEQPIAWALTSALHKAALFSWFDAPCGEPSARAQRFEIVPGLARGPPALG